LKKIILLSNLIHHQLISTVSYAPPLNPKLQTPTFPLNPKNIREEVVASFKNTLNFRIKHFCRVLYLKFWMMLTAKVSLNLSTTWTSQIRTFQIVIQSKTTEDSNFNNKKSAKFSAIIFLSTNNITLIMPVFMKKVTNSIESYPHKCIHSLTIDTTITKKSMKWPPHYILAM